MPIIAIFYWFLLSVVWGIGIIRYKKLTTPFKILNWSVLFVLLLTIAATVYHSKYKTNAPILHIECVNEFAFYSIIYYSLFKNKLIKRLIVVALILIIGFAFVNALFLQPFYTVFPTNMYPLTQILYAIFSLLLFNEMLRYPLKINIIKQSVFWYNTAILFYATIMFFTLGLSNYLPSHNIHDHFIFYFWYMILYLFHILIGVALLTDNKKIAINDA
jgi:hypothetical protein